MNISIIAVGKLRESYYKAGVEDYLDRIKHFLPVEHIEVPVGTGEESNGKGKGAIIREAASIEKVLKPDSRLIVLDPAGTVMTTEQLYAWIQKSMNESASRLSFVIGGAWGLDKNLCEKADLRLSLSAFTMPHELARLVLVEQIYRVLSLWKSLPYHK